MQSNSQNRRDRFEPKAMETAEPLAAEESVKVTDPAEDLPESLGHRSEIAPVDEAADPVVEEKSSVYGVVTDCLRLNIREAPKADAEIATVIDALSEVMVDMDGSTDEFYKVCTASGIEGFCMRKFIAVRR